MASLLALILLGQALSPARTIDEPVWWPTGKNAQAIATDTGFALLMVDDYDRTVMRFIGPDGALSKPVNIGGTSPGVALIRTSLGALTLYTPRNTSKVVSRLLDLTTGEPLGPPNELTSTIGIVLTGSPGRVTSIGSRVLTDGGRETLVTRFNDDGTEASSVIVPTISGVGSISSNSTRHWVASRTYPPDGGWITAVASLNDDAVVQSQFEVLGLHEALIATEQAIVIVSTLPGETKPVFSFYDFDGTLIGSGPIDALCWAVVGRVVGDDVLLACAGTGTQYTAQSLQMFRVSPDGGVAHSEVWAGDGGQLTVSQVLPGYLVFERMFSDVHRGNWRATYLLPLSSDGLSAAGPIQSALERPSSQSYPSFATRERGIPNALAWSDDRTLPREPLVRTVRLSSSGALASPIADMEKLGSQFTAYNNEGRFISTDGTSFMTYSWNGFDVVPIEWPFDGGRPITRTELNTGFGIFGAPFTAPASETPGAGYLTAWTSYPNWHIRRIDSHGVPLAGQVPIGVVFDLLAVGDRQLQAVGESSGGLRILTTNDAGVMTQFAWVDRQDAGILSARLAKSNSTVMIAWHVGDRAGGTRAFATRFDLDGGAIDAVPFMTDEPERVAVRDIGVRNGVFHVMGLASDGDGGSSLWVWRVGVDGGSRVYRDINEINAVVAGPLLDDGSLSFAYSQNQPDWSPIVQRVYLRSIIEPVEVGMPCERGSDCASGFCTDGLCCATEHGCDLEPDGGPARGIGIYQLRCGCDSSGLSLWWLVLLVIIRRRR